MPTLEFGYAFIEQTSDSSDSEEETPNSPPGVSGSSETETSNNTNTSSHGSRSNGELSQQRILIAEEIPDQSMEILEASTSAVGRNAGPITQDQIRQSQPPADEDIHPVVVTSPETSANESSTQQADSPFWMENRLRNPAPQVACSAIPPPQPQANPPNLLDDNAGNRQDNPMAVHQDLQVQLPLLAHNPNNADIADFDPQLYYDPEIINVFMDVEHDPMPVEQLLQLLMPLPNADNANFDPQANFNPDQEIIGVFENEEYEGYWGDFL